MAPETSQLSLAGIRIILVAPAGPLNVGSTARVMKNFGLSQLVLVNPQCDPLSEEALQMAVHAKDVLSAAKIVETIPDALSGCTYAIATTARQRGFNAPLDLPEIALPTLISPSPDGDPISNTALLFGPEDRGLSNTELSYAQRFIKIPSSPIYSALNLAQAVAICCYELYRIASQPAEAQQNANIPFDSSPTLPNDSPVASLPLPSFPLSGKQSEEYTHKAQLDELEGYYQHLEAVLLQVGYLYPHTATSRMLKLRQLLHKANPASSEVALLRGMLRQVEWALSDSKQD
ncbi:MAG: tRNA/rRNA methyltransferase [Phormidesmis priestleyi Ana]|uniref:tRNA (cytidine/uridine-2'-O-)-methyltransferase TrmJ n=1 Tax=Phormidesmis priestleyi Ana TaxID=1666911 RepID=A0A0P7ZSM5_9CYAN|nr:MAG: tRNA/rRNA methyltransferase [Phormidesmis priestleyi Ana]